MNSSPEKKYRFADFDLDTTKRLLLKAGKPVPLNSKTLDLLETLIERHGEVVPKDELLETIWAGQFVEESNLTVQISTLRKVLGEARGENRFIVTVPGKGYRFVGELEQGVDEITIENHSFSRIIVAEEIEEIGGQSDGHLVERRKITAGQLERSWLKRNLAGVGLLTALLLLTAIGGFYALRQRQNAAVPFAQTQIRQLTNNGKVQIAALSHDGKLYAYVTDDMGERAVWLGQTDGGGKSVQIRPPTDADYGTLAFSPDGGSLYFSLRDEANPAYAIFRMPTLGGAVDKLVDRLAVFALAPDGTHIAFARFSGVEKTDEIFVADVAGGEPHKIAAMDPVNSVISASLSFSSDGKTIAYAAVTGVGTQEIFTVQISNGEIRQITSQVFNDINKTAWLMDGSGLMLTGTETKEWSGVPQFRVWHVAFPDGKTSKVTSDLSSYSGVLGVSKDILLTVEHRQLNNIWIAPADDLKQSKQITFGSFGKYEGLWGLDWTPDGRIVFDSSDAQSQVISIMNSDGSNKKQLTAPGQFDSCLTVSNDGRYVIFHSSRGGGVNIWRLDIENGSLKPLTFGRENYHPAISSDSRSVFYKSRDDGLGELRRVPIDGGESVALTDKETSWMSVSPDGTFIAARYKTDKNRLAVIPIEGGEPVKQFDTPKTALFYVGIRWMPDSKAIAYRDTAYGYWSQSIDGGPPVRMENLPKEFLYNFAWSKDGKQFAFVRGEEISDVVLFHDVK